jgi:hypothetical protein
MAAVEVCDLSKRFGDVAAVMKFQVGSNGPVTEAVRHQDGQTIVAKKPG